MSSSRGSSAVRVVQKKLQKIVQEFISSDRVVALIQGVTRGPDTEVLFNDDGVAEYADDVIALEADVNAALKSCSRGRGKKQEAAALQEEFRVTLNEAFDGIFDSEASPKPASSKRGRDPDDIDTVAPPKRSASKRNSETAAAVGGLSSDEKAKLKEIVGKVMKNPAAEVFLYPVDSKMYPEYYEIVETPMDLTTIKQNINTYESVADALEDMRLIWKNCFTFNLEGSDISKMALSLGTDFEKLVEAKFGKGFVDTKWKKLFRKPPAIAVDSQTLVPAAPDSAKRPKAEKKKAGKAGGGYADVSLLNIADVKQIVQELVDDPRAELFLEPVDSKLAPGYHDMITTPMDLGTIHKKLRGNKYFDYVNQVINDVRLVWRNCETYNDPDSEIVATVGELSDFFESRLSAVSNARKQELKAAQKKQAQAAAAASKPATHKSQASASSMVVAPSEPVDNFKDYVAKALYKSLSVNALKDLMNVLNAFEEIGPFLHPVSDEDAPGYSRVISKPMAVKTIERKFALGSYHHKPADFVDDVRLIWSNCLKYNLPESEFYQMAEDNRRLFEESLLVAIRKDEERYYDANPPDYKAPEGDVEGDEQDGEGENEGDMEEDDDEDDVNNGNGTDGKRNADIPYEKKPKQKATMYTYDENGRKKRIYCTFRVRKYRYVLRLVMAHELAAPFSQLQANPTYFEAVEQPLDLITIRERAQEYQDMPLGFLADLKLVFDNWLSFNEPSSQIYQAARAVKCHAVDCYFQNFLSMISFKTAEDEECIREHKLNSRNPLPASGDPFAPSARKETTQSAPKAAGTHQSLFPAFSHKKLIDLENKLQLLTTGDERVQSRALRESARATASQVLKETKVMPFVVSPTLYEVYDFGVIDPRPDVEAHCEDAIFPNKFTVLRAFRIAVVPASKQQLTAKEVKQYPYVPFTLRGMIQAGPTLNDKVQFIVSLENRTIVTQTRNARESWMQVFDNLEGILNCLGGKLRRCRAVLNRVCISPDCQDFLEQVSLEFVDYYKNISSPMWFREIYNRLNECTYDNEFDFAWDMRLVFRNCKMYNAPNSTLYKSADRLSILFEQLFVAWVVNIQDKSVADVAKGDWDQWYDLRYFDSPETKQARYRCKLSGEEAALSNLVQCSSCEDLYLPASVGLEGTKLKQKWFCSRCTRALELSAQNLGGDPYANDPKEADSVYNAIELGGNCFVPAPDVGAGWCQARKKNRSGGLKSMFLSPLGYELEKKELIPLQREFEEAVDKDLLSARAKEFQETLRGCKASGSRRGSKRRSTAKGRCDASKQQPQQQALSTSSANATADDQQDYNEDSTNVDSSTSTLHPIDSKVLENNRMVAGNMFGFEVPPGFRLALCGPENEEIIIDKHRKGQDVSKFLEAFVPIEPETVPPHGYFGFHISDIRLRVEGLDKSVDCAKYEFLMGGKMKDQFIEDMKSELQRLQAFSQGEKNIKAVLLHERWVFEKTKAYPVPPQRLLNPASMDLDDQGTSVKDGFRRLFPQKQFDGLEVVLSLWDFLDSCQSIGFTHFSLAELVPCIQQPTNMTQFVSQVVFDEIGCICTDLLFQDLKWRRVFSPTTEQRWQDLCMIYPINVMTWTKVLERVLLIFAMPLSVMEAESLLAQPLQDDTMMTLKVLSLLYNHPLIDAFVTNASTAAEGEDEVLTTAREALNDVRKGVFDVLVAKPKEFLPVAEGEEGYDDAMQIDEDAVVDTPAPIATAESVAESLLQIFTAAAFSTSTSVAHQAKCVVQWLKALFARLGLFPADATTEDAVDPETGFHAVNRTWGSFTFADATFSSMDVIMPYHFMIKPPSVYETKMTLLTSFERVLTLLHSSDSDDWNASDRLAVFSVLHDNCAVINEFQRDVKDRQQYLARFENLEGTAGLDAMTAETLAQGQSFIPENSICHFTGVPFVVLPDPEKWTLVPLLYRQSEVISIVASSANTATAIDVDGDNKVDTIAPYLRQEDVSETSSDSAVYALKDALNRVINCRKLVKREREQYEGYMETIANQNFPRAPKLNLLSSLFLRSKPVGYDADGNVYWLLNVQSKMTLFPFDSARHALDPTDNQTTEPCILLRDLTGTWYYHDARNMQKLIRDLNNPTACERLLRYRLAEKLTITSHALRDSTLLIKGYQTPWLDRKVNIERWLADQQIYTGPNEMHKCRQLEALLGRAMEIRMHIYYAYLFKYDDEVERSSERAEKEAILRKQRKYKEDCLEEIFDLHPRRGWNRLDLFTRFRQLSATSTATRIVSDPVISKAITGNVLSKALFLQRNAVDPTDTAAEGEGDDDVPAVTVATAAASVSSAAQPPIAPASTAPASATNVIVKEEEASTAAVTSIVSTKEEESTAMEVDEPFAPQTTVKAEAATDKNNQPAETKDEMQIDQVESSFAESSNNRPNTADEERHELGIVHRNVPNYELNGSWPQKTTRAVEQLHSETNEVLRIYPSGRHVAMFLDVSQSGISQCLNNIKPDCYGFKWRWYAGPSLDFEAIESQQTPLHVIKHMMVNRGNKSGYNLKALSTSFGNSAFLASLSAGATAVTSTRSSGRTSTGSLSRPSIGAVSAVTGQQPAVDLSRHSFPPQTQLRLAPATVHVVTSFKVTTAKLIKLKAELLNIFYCFPEKSLKWPALDAEGEAAVEKSGEEAKEQTRAALLIQQPNLSEEEILKAIEKNERKATRRLRRKLSLDRFMTGVQNAVTVQEMMTLVITLESAVPLELTFKHEKQALGTGANAVTSADVALRLFVLDRSISYDSIGNVENAPLILPTRPRFHFAPRCHAQCFCVRYMGHIGKCSNTGTLFSRLPDHFQLAPPSDPFSSQRGNSIAYTTSSSALPLSQSQQLAANEIAKRTGGTNYASTYRGLEGFGTAHLTLAELMDKTNVDIETVQGYIPTQVEITTFHWL